jgi:ornithine carbamoyltransferase
MSVPAAQPRHFLDLADYDTATLREILAIAGDIKAGRYAPVPLAGRTLALLFEKPSTRTRVSFEVAMRKLGGHVTILTDRDMQLGRGETVADTARVLSRYVDAIMLRTDRVWKLAELAANATVPVINGLTEASHPCQLMADIMTFEQHRGPIAGRTLAWLGDGNNVARSWVQAAVRFGFSLRMAAPLSCQVPDAVLEWARAQGGDVTVTRDPAEAVAGVAAVVTDCFVSMSDDPGRNSQAALAPYRVTTGLMEQAGEDALFLHCLPAHRGEEVESAVIDGRWSVVFDEAENRLYAQAGILVWVMDRRAKEAILS